MATVKPTRGNAAQPEFRFGEGRISGVLGTTLGALSLLAVLCFRHPELLTTPELREVYPMPLVRGVLFTALLAAQLLGLVSIVLQRRFGLGLAGIALSGLAILLGGAWVEVDGPVESPRYVGLDWFVLDLLALALIFVPLERLFARLAEQPVLRRGWRTDLAYFFVSHMLVQVTVLLTMAPAALLLGRFVRPGFQAVVAAQPLWLQFLGVMLCADLFQYAVHRAFHALPWLWRFHSIHHSSTEMDWLAGSRLHLFDVVVTRAFSFVPLFLIGFSAQALTAYLFFVSFHAVFIHANVRFRLWPLRWIVVTPLFHHWHHGAEPEAVDVNFAVHLPWIDRIFGTAYLPERWPAGYGIAAEPIPESFTQQLVYPFQRPRG
jgi:lathosterol oxidase